MSTTQSIQIPSLRNECISETVGTYLLVFFGPGSIVLLSSSSLTPLLAQEAIAIVFGCTVALVITFLGGISGAQINPAVTIAIAVSGRLMNGRLVPYLLSQISGALLAGLTLAVVFHYVTDSAYLGSTKLAPSIPPFEGLLLEIIGTLILSFSALTAGTFLRTSLAQGALVGTTLFILITLIGPLTGASFNPARSLGPSLFSGYYNDQLIYYVGPVLGGVIAGMMFSRIPKSEGVREI